MVSHILYTLMLLAYCGGKKLIENIVDVAFYLEKYVNNIFFIF